MESDKLLEAATAIFVEAIRYNGQGTRRGYIGNNREGEMNQNTTDKPTIPVDYGAANDRSIHDCYESANINNAGCQKGGDNQKTKELIYERL